MICPRCGATVDLEHMAACPACGRELGDLIVAPPVAPSAPGGSAGPGIGSRFLRILRPVAIPSQPASDDAGTSEAVGGYATITCPYCGTENVRPSQPVRCLGLRCPATVTPDGLIGVPRREMLAEIWSCSSWLVIWGGLAKWLTPGVRFLPEAMILAGMLAATLRQRWVFGLSALLLAGMGGWNVFNGIGGAYWWVAVGVFQLYLAAVDFRNFRRFRRTVPL